MSCFINILLLIGILHHAINEVCPHPQNVASLFFKPHSSSKDAATSLGCFSDYIFQMKEVSEAYSEDYNQCLLDAKADREANENDMSNKRLLIGESSQDVCKQMSACDGMHTTLEVFHCHSKFGANNTKAIYSISGNASEYASVLQEKYRIIDFRYELCCKSSERKYVEATGANYRNLQSCLDGHTKPSLSTDTTKPALFYVTPQSTMTSLTHVASVSSETQPPHEIIDTTTSEAAELISTVLLPSN